MLHNYPMFEIGVSDYNEGRDKRFGEDYPFYVDGWNYARDMDISYQEDSWLEAAYEDANGRGLEDWQS